MKTESLFGSFDFAVDSPLSWRLAPETLKDFFGQSHLLAPGKILSQIIAGKNFSSSIFFGPPGCGKTALARLIARELDMEATFLNAVASGVSELKKALDLARERRLFQNKRSLLIIDEIHHFNRTQQDVLLPATEKGEVVLIGLTTENPSFYVNAALLSRLATFEFKPLTEQDLKKILNAALENEEVKKMKVRMDGDAQNHLIVDSSGDARKLINAFERAVLSAEINPTGERRIDLNGLESSLQKRVLRYDKKSDDHYDHISAFIKSLRGSDPDAALYWMAKMLKAGEDPRFIARRLLICASEDVGNADFRALLICNAAFEAVEKVGMPEARIILAQACVYVACAPKSNASYLAIDAAMEEVEKGPAREVPHFLRDSNLDSKSRGHGAGYQYPHDFPGHYVFQEYLPSPVRFYHPTEEGDEKRLSARLKELRKKTNR